MGTEFSFLKQFLKYRKMNNMNGIQWFKTHLLNPKTVCSKENRSSINFNPFFQSLIAK